MERNKAFASSGDWRNTPRLPFLPFKGLYNPNYVDPRGTERSDKKNATTPSAMTYLVPQARILACHTRKSWFIPELLSPGG
jgi:hypothetical protein